MVNTLKRERLAKEILNPDNKTLLQAGTKAGYTSKQIYRKSTKQHLAEILQAQGISKENLTEAYKHLLTLCQSKQDYSTAKGTLDSLAKMYNHLKEGNTQQTIERVIISYDTQVAKGQEVKTENGK